jgi:hypothetical protein
MEDFVKLSLKGQEFTATALDFDQLQALEQPFEALKGLGEGGGMPTAEQRTAIVTIVTASLQFKHAGTTEAQVAKLLTLANIGSALQAVAGISGLEKAEPGNA